MRDNRGLLASITRLPTQKLRALLGAQGLAHRGPRGWGEQLLSVLEPNLGLTLSIPTLAPVRPRPPASYWIRGANCKRDRIFSASGFIES